MDVDSWIFWLLNIIFWASSVRTNNVRRELLAPQVNNT